MDRAAALEHADAEFPIESDRRVHAHGRRGGFVTGSLWPAEEYEAVAGLGTHLQSAKLLLPSLWQPRHDGARSVRFDELLSDPQALGRKFSLHPDQLPFVETFVHQAREVGMAARADDDDLAAVGHHAPKRRAEQAPLEHRWLGCQHLGQGLPGPTSAWEFGVEIGPA